MYLNIIKHQMNIFKLYKLIGFYSFNHLIIDLWIFKCQNLLLYYQMLYFFHNYCKILNKSLPCGWHSLEYLPCKVNWASQHLRWKYTLNSIFRAWTQFGQMIWYSLQQIQLISNPSNNLKHKEAEYVLLQNEGPVSEL